MDFGLKGKVALVTGGGRGIGKAVSLMFAEQGANVAICGRTIETLEATAEEIRAKGVECWPMVADVSKNENVVAFVKESAAKAGGIDILVNNAVSSVRAPFDEQTDEMWQNHINVKLMAYIRSAREAFPYMRERGWGRIVNIGGMTARISSPYRITNGIVNAGVANFTKAFGDFVGPHNITVNCVVPGTTATDRMIEGFSRYAKDAGVSIEEIAEEKKALIPMRRFTQPEDIANAVLFFCSPLANVVTGQSLAVDGGIGESINY